MHTVFSSGVSNTATAIDFGPGGASLPMPEQQVLHRHHREGARGDPVRQAEQDEQRVEVVPEQVEAGALDFDDRKLLLVPAFFEPRGQRDLLAVVLNLFA